jgi:hypothetical protein
MAQESKLSSSGNGSKDSDANLMNGAVHRLVVESMEDARATAADDGERIEVFEEVAPVESGILRSTFRPVQRGTLVIAGITLLGAMGAARLIAHGGSKQGR